MLRSAAITRRWEKERLDDLGRLFIGPHGPLRIVAGAVVDRWREHEPDDRPWSPRREAFPRVDGRIDLRGVPIPLQATIRGKRFEGVDFSDADLHVVHLESNRFEDCRFDGARLSQVRERGNEFVDCSFEATDFGGASIGQGGSDYVGCRFTDNQWSGLLVSATRFVSCEFVGCSMRSIDFNASTFENVSFTGTLEEVWFRGEPASAPVGEDWQPNLMDGVDFSAAELKSVMFTDRIPVGGIKLPSEGYVAVADFPGLVHRLQRDDLSGRADVDLFLRIYWAPGWRQKGVVLNLAEVCDFAETDMDSPLLHAVREAAI